ncbi:MAG: Ig-like domain-containing protein, partial [Planctomycetota bacterium]|nr:Ig-like domain-containing protein [Planctomycetota bacterium]
PVLVGGFNRGDVNTNGLLDPGETWEYEATMPAPGVTDGQYTNIATVTGNPVDAGGIDIAGLDDQSDTDASNHFGALVQDGIWVLHDHPDFGYAMILSGLLPGDSYTSEFHFDAPEEGASVIMEVDGPVITISGTVWGGQPGEEQLWEIFIQYIDGEIAPTDDDTLAQNSNPGATLTSVDDPTEVYFIDAYAGSNPFALQLGNTEDDSGLFGFDGISGFGWLNHDQTPGQDVDEFGNFITNLHSGPSDGAFTAQYAGPVPITPNLPELAVEYENPLHDNIDWVFFSGDTVDFGSIPAGTVETFAIKNVGDADLDLTGLVTLTSNPAGAFTLAQPTDTSLAPGEVATFTVTMNATTVGSTPSATITIPNNDFDEGTFTFTVNAEVANPGVTLQNLLIAESGGSTAVTEGGNTDSYTLAFDTEPAGIVEVTVTPDSQTDLGAGAGTEILLTFTPEDFATPQTVIVTAENDTAVEGSHTSLLTHSVNDTQSASSTSGGSSGAGDLLVNITDDDAPAPSGLFLDFGTAGSAVAGSYTGLTHTDAYSPTPGYGWQAGSSISSRDRDTGNALLEDFVNVTGGGNATFLVDVPNGDYDVTITLGDVNPKNGMGVILEGEQVATVTTAAGVYDTQTHRVTVNDGQLTLRLERQGTTAVTINALEVAAVVTGPDTTGARITSMTPSGDAVGPVSSVTVTFNEAINAGTFTTADVTIADPAAGSVTPLSVNDLGGNQFEITFAAQSTLGAYTVTVGPDISDLASPAGNAMNQDQDTTNGEATEDQFVDSFTLFTPSAFSPLLIDFGTAGSAVAGSYTGLTHTDAYSPTPGYGWQAGSSVFSLDRDTGNALLEDFVNVTSSGGNATFLVDVPNGDYDVTITLGDVNPKNGMGVILEGEQVATVTTAAGVYDTQIHRVTVNDGQLTLRLERQGTTAVTINALEVAELGPRVAVSQSNGSTDLVEGAVTDTYDIRLNTLPAGDVQVTVSADGQSEVSLDGTIFSSSAVLTFTNQNGTTLQTVTVRAIDDTDVEGFHTSTISHAITSSADLTDYPLSTVIKDVVANVTDDDGVQFAVIYTDDANEGFNDLILGATRRAALEFALNIWSIQIARNFVGETITIDAAMDDFVDANVLGSATAIDYFTATQVFGVGNVPAGIDPVTYYAAPLANHLHGSDLDASTAEIDMQFNSSFASWYYGTDGNPPGNEWDFVTVVLHEVGHGLNFLDLINQNGNWTFGSPGIYDTFLERDDGTDLTALNSSQRQSVIISNDLYWNGANGTSENNGTRVQIYAPNPYEGGSSVSHLDEGVHGNELMSPSVGSGQAIHAPSNIELGMMTDMGWTITSGGEGRAATAGGGKSATPGGGTSARGDGNNFRVREATGENLVGEDVAVMFHASPESVLPARWSSLANGSLLVAIFPQTTPRLYDAFAWETDAAEPLVSDSFARTSARHEQGAPHAPARDEFFAAFGGEVRKRNGSDPGDDELAAHWQTIVDDDLLLDALFRRWSPALT